MNLIDDSPAPPGTQPEYTVSELSGAVKRVIEGEFGLVRVRGEMGRVSRPASGHLYFDLKDDQIFYPSETKVLSEFNRIWNPDFESFILVRQFRELLDDVFPHLGRGYLGQPLAFVPSGGCRGPGHRLALERHHVHLGPLWQPAGRH